MRKRKNQQQKKAVHHTDFLCFSVCSFSLFSESIVLVLCLFFVKLMNYKSEQFTALVFLHFFLLCCCSMLVVTIHTKLIYIIILKILNSAFRILRAEDSRREPLKRPIDKIFMIYCCLCWFLGVLCCCWYSVTNAFTYN